MSARPAKETAAVPPEIQTRLEAAGLRRTLATRAVLGLFLANPQGTLSHAQALASLQTRGLEINRVTLYRLLDRLATCGVLAAPCRRWRPHLAIRPGRHRRRAGAPFPMRRLPPPVPPDRGQCADPGRGERSVPHARRTGPSGGACGCVDPRHLRQLCAVRRQGQRWRPLAVIATHGLRHAYPGGPALHFHDIAVPQGGTLLLRGPSGSGKSTWLALAAGLLTPQAGEMRVAGQAVAALRAR